MSRIYNIAILGAALFSIFAVPKARAELVYVEPLKLAADLVTGEESAAQG